MPRPPSRIAPEWWDYTTLDAEVIRDTTGLAPTDLVRLRSLYAVTLSSLPAANASITP